MVQVEADRHRGRLRDLGLPEEVAAHLLGTHLGRYHLVAAAIGKDRSLGERIVPSLPTVWAEIPVFATEEMAIRLEDVMCRRTALFFKAADQGLAVAERVAALLGGALGWNETRRADEVAAYRRLVEAHRRFRDGVSG